MGQFGRFQPSKSAKIHENQNSDPLNVLKWHIFNFKNPRNRIHVKSKIANLGKFQPSKSAKIQENQNSGPVNVLKWHISHF